MGTIFMHHPCKDYMRQIANMLGKALQTQFFFIDLDVIDGTLITSKTYEQYCYKSVGKTTTKMKISHKIFETFQHSFRSPKMKWSQIVITRS